jgi:hypothetical protein
MMDILALDMATKTGWVTNIHGKRSGVIEFALERDDNEAVASLLLKYAPNKLNKWCFNFEFQYSAGYPLIW